MTIVDEFNATHGIEGKWHYIYLLIDPRSDEVRYVGMSHNPGARLLGHIGESRRRNTHKHAWIRSLAKLGLTPRQEILDAVPHGTDWQTVERAYIAGAKEAGYRLTNLTAGGEGVVELDPEVKERIRQKRLGRKDTPETIARKSAAAKGGYRSPQWRAHMSQVMKGRTISADHRARVRDGNQRLTADQVREIRRLLRTGISQSAIAPIFGVSNGTISNINIGRTYSHVLDHPETDPS